MSISSDKGGINDWPSRVTERPPQPGSMVATETSGPLKWYGFDLGSPDGDKTAYHVISKRHTAYNDNRSTDRSTREGIYISTFTGRFWPFAPKPEDVRVVDIAHGLAMSCRYTGAVKRFYATAEHSVHIARWLMRYGYGARTALAGLMHDAPEALSGFGDNARPSKQKAPIIKETEERIYRLAVAPAFGLDPELPAIVHEADGRIIADEMQQNMHEVDPSYNNPLGVKLEYWSPDRAEDEFLMAYWDLTRRVAA